MRRALGKGLTQFLDEPLEAPPADVAVEAVQPNPRQPRRHFDEEALAELAASIREHGVLQPLVVRPVGDERFELIAGERRLRAAKLAGLKTVPVSVRTASAQASLEIALIENVQREDINPIECAEAYRMLAEEFGLNQDQVAAKVGKSRAAVSNTLRLLKLSEDVQAAVQDGRITEGHARALLMVDSPVRQRALFERIVAEGLSVRETERLARGEARPPQAPKSAEERREDPNVVRIQSRLSEHFGAKVKVDHGRNRGRISIEYFSEDELEGILEKMGLVLG
ncbi:MAG: ParB/RepB/Spo0J family partition protein [Armatimonadetes bacterium]|nr:ParB/RepB/Spo0J family partition protein [Armatimonadota bacterium]